MIQYMFPPGKQPDTEEDSIALGFITTKSDAVLLRIESSTTQDYMELEIVIYFLISIHFFSNTKHKHDSHNDIQIPIPMVTFYFDFIQIAIG